MKTCTVVAMSLSLFTVQVRDKQTQIHAKNTLAKNAHARVPVRSMSLNARTARLISMYEVDYCFPIVGVLLFIYNTTLVPEVFCEYSSYLELYPLGSK